MQTNTLFQMVREYNSPSIKRITVAVEQGFAASYGDNGNAGPDFGSNDYDF